MKATRTLPTRFPIQVQTQFESRSPADALRVRTPRVRTRLLPVNSSEPAKMTIVSAPPKQMPMVMRTRLGEVPTIEPPIVKIKTIAAPTYMPASIERTKWLANERRWAVIFAAACSAMVWTVSEYMVITAWRTLGSPLPQSEPHSEGSRSGARSKTEAAGCMREVVPRKRDESMPKESMTPRGRDLRGQNDFEERSDRVKFGNIPNLPRRSSSYARLMSDPLPRRNLM